MTKIVATASSPRSSAFHFHQEPTTGVAAAVALFVTACLSIWVTRGASGVALLWPGDALAACLLIRGRQVHWIVAITAVFAAALLANLVAAHRTLSAAALFAVPHVVEIALMVVCFRSVWIFPYPKITIGQAAWMTAVLGVVIPGLNALLASSVLQNHLTAAFDQRAMQWWSSHALGACLVGPVVILYSRAELIRLTRSRFLLVNVLTVAGTLLGSYLAIRFVRFPFAIIGFLLLSAAFRLGGFGTACLSFSVGFLVANLWLLGIRPMGLDEVASASTSLIGLPVVALLAALMPPITVGIGSDVRRAAAKSMLASERRFREAMEHSPIGTLLADMSGVWGYTNIALQKMLGYSATELKTMPPGGPSASEDWKESKERWQKLLDGSVQSYNVTRRFRHKAGHWIWTEVSVSLLRDETGAPLQLIAQIESLEVRRQAEEAVAAERERLKITLSAISDAVVTTDSECRITFVNPAAEALLGLAFASARGRRVQEMVHLSNPSSSESVPDLLAQTLLHGTVSRREHPCLLHRPDGSLCYVSDHVSPVYDSAGGIIGSVAVFRDSSREVDLAAEFRFQATHDALTGLSNRAEFARRLEIAFKSAQHRRRPAVIVAIDLDRFKAVNDSAGHAAGDAMLKKVGETCRMTVRGSDTVARLGGDEFAILLENCPEPQAHRIARQLLQALNGLSIEWNGSSYSIGASIGLALDSPEWSDAKQWLEAADSACYRAKKHGRGQIRWHHLKADNVVSILQPRL